MRVRRGFVGLVAFAAAVGLAVPVLSVPTPSAGAAPPPGLPPGLQPNVVNATNQRNSIFGEPEIAVNPTNPNNLVYVATQLADTPDCQTNAANPYHASCQLLQTVFGPQPAGLINNVPGFSPNGIEVSFDRGRSWTSVTVPTLPPPCPAPGACNDPTGFLNGGDPAITVTPDGTFVFSEDVINFQTGFPPQTPTIARDAGIATSVSADGGLTWSTPVLSGTAADRDFITTDPNTGRVYEESGAGPLGSGSTANPDAPNVPPAGRYLVASPDGVHWTAPEFLGTGISGPYISAANGVLVTGGRSTSAAVCGVPAPTACELLRTTTDDGAHWSQSVVPGSSDSWTSGPLVAADPTTPGHVTVAFLNSAATTLVVEQTTDGGTTWIGPTDVAENANTHWKPWMDFNSDGTLGLMWRTWTGAAGSSPYNVWAAISTDGGSTFSNPLEVSNGDSPASTPVCNLPGGFGLPPTNPPCYAFTNTFADDFSFITLSHQDAFIAWADWRPGGGTQRQGFVSIVKLQAFTHGMP